MQNKKVLVTGGAGFIGSHLVEQLINLGAQVTVLDNLSTGSLDNLTTIKNHFTFIRGDITSLQDCLKACTGQEFVFHLAAKISVAESMKNPTPCYETNVLGTLHMLQACVAQNVERFIFSSSAAVYGAQENPCHETMICNPESPMAVQNCLASFYAKAFIKIMALKRYVYVILTFMANAKTQMAPMLQLLHDLKIVCLTINPLLFLVMVYKHEILLA